MADRSAALEITPIEICTAGFPDAGNLDGAVLHINLGAGPYFDFGRRLAAEGVPFLCVTGYDKATIREEFSLRASKSRHAVPS